MSPRVSENVVPLVGFVTLTSPCIPAVKVHSMSGPFGGELVVGGSFPSSKLTMYMSVRGIYIYILYI